MNSRLLLLALIILPISIFSQNLKKGFKLLQSGDMIEARVIFNQAKDDPAMKSAAYFGLAKIESTKSRRGNDMFKAFEYIVKADKFAEDMNPKIVSKISDYYSVDKVKSERKKIDTELYNEVKTKNKVELVDKFIIQCEASDYFLEMIAIKASLEYENVKSYNTEKAYITFINHFPESKEADDARLRLSNLVWQKTVEENTIASYSLFIKDYPEAEQLDSAKTNLMTLEYQKALVLNTDEAFGSFIDKYPESDLAKKLEEKRVAMAYDRARILGTIEVYQSFLDKYPISEYSPAAKSCRDSLAFNEAKEMNTSKAYCDFVNAYPNAEEVPLAMELLGNMSFSVAELTYIKKLDAIKELRIKSYSAYRMDSVEGDSSFVEESVRYDTLGHEMVYMVHPAEGMQTRIENEFDEENELLLVQKTYINDKLQKESRFTYVWEGLIKTESVILYFDRGRYPAEYISTFAYDSLRNLISKKDSSIMDSTVVAWHSYSYNTKWYRVLEEITFSDSTKQVITYAYDSKHNLIEKATKNNEGKVTELYSYTYDDTGRKVAMRKINAVGVINHTYTYGNKGVIEQEVIDINKGSDIVELKYKYEYFE
jgi:hypothetical protein